MEKLREEILGCKRCELRGGCKGPVPGSGLEDARVMLIGESPGENEDKTKQPFTGLAGQELNGNLEKAKISRQNVWITNLVKCRPDNDKTPPDDAIAKCKKWLKREIDSVDPEIIVTMGATSSKALLGRDFNIEQGHGFAYKRKIFGRDQVVVPVFHPALGLHDGKAMHNIREDFIRVGGAVRDWTRFRPPKDQYPDPVYRAIGDEESDWLLKYFSNLAPGRAVDGAYTGPLVAIDTETTELGPWCLSFSTRPGEAYVIKVGEEEAIGVVAEFVARPYVTTILHNAMFDLDVLKEMGIEPSNVVDTMVAAYLIQDLPQGLKTLSYRLLGMEMDDYSDLVAPATRRKATAYLKEVSEYHWPDPEPILEWADGKPKVKRPQPIQTKINRIFSDIARREYVEKSIELLMSDRHEEFEWNKKYMPKNRWGEDPEDRWQRLAIMEERLKSCPEVDPNARWNNFDESERVLIESCLGKLRRGTLDDLPSETAIYYSARDADATFRLWEILHKRLTELGLVGTFSIDMAIIPMVADMQRNGFRIDREYFADLSKEFAKEMEEVNSEIDGAIGRHINPSSPNQVSNLLYRELQLVPNNKKRSKKTGAWSTDDEALQALSNEHPIVPRIQRYRAISKLKSSFCDTIPVKADQDDRVHPNVRTTRTSTGRLSCSDPNLMAIPIRTQDGQKIRGGFVPEDGCSLVSGDYSQIEMRLVAHMAQDEEMLRIFREGEDIHAITASRIFGIPVDRLDKMLHRYPAKRVGFGVLNGLTPEGLLDQLILGGCTGWDVKGCKDLITEWFRMYKGINGYFSKTKAFARRKGYVQDFMGRIRLIPEIRSKVPWIVEKGERNACSAVIQGGAQGIMKSAMRDMTPVYRGYDSMGYICRPLIQIHDDLVWEVDDEIVEQFKQAFKGVMENAVQLSLPLEVDVKSGKNWSEMEAEE